MHLIVTVFGRSPRQPLLWLLRGQVYFLVRGQVYSLVSGKRTKRIEHTERIERIERIERTKRIERIERIEPYHFRTPLLIRTRWCLSRINVAADTAFDAR